MTTPTPWATLEAEAATRLSALRRHVREWAATHHATTRCRRLPGHVLAAMDATSRPVRVRLLRLADHTQREAAEAGADDLWDAAAVCWSMVQHGKSCGLAFPHVVAELVNAGGWLARFPAHASVHDKALAELFALVEVAA